VLAGQRGGGDEEDLLLQCSVPEVRGDVVVVVEHCCVFVVIEWCVWRK
jgi:hypothetical protein